MALNAVIANAIKMLYQIRQGIIDGNAKRILEESHRMKGFIPPCQSLSHIRSAAEFYNPFLTGKTYTEALRAVQLKVRANSPNPFHWAAFTVIGEGDRALIQN